MLKAKHIMTKNVISVKKDTPVYQCLELMAKHTVSGIPVVEDDKDFMTQPSIYFDENESLLDICNLLAKNIFRKVPIASNGKLVGIISRGDIIAHIVKARKSVGQELCP